MDLFEAIDCRVSTRAFKTDPLREGDLERIMGTAILAPSAGNLQPWSFVVSRGQPIKEPLAEAALGQSFIAEAPVVVTVFAVEAYSARRYGSRGRELYCIQDTAAATENILLAAAALGYGACWVGAFDEEGVRRVLGAPAGARPVAIVPLGFPADRPPRVRRKPLEEVLWRETYGGGKPRKILPESGQRQR